MERPEVFEINLEIDSLECDKELIEIKLSKLKKERKSILRNLTGDLK